MVGRLVGSGKNKKAKCFHQHNIILFDSLALARSTYDDDDDDVYNMVLDAMYMYVFTNHILHNIIAQIALHKYIHR